MADEIDKVFVKKGEWLYWQTQLMFDTRPDFDFEFIVRMDSSGDLRMRGSRVEIKVEQFVDKGGNIFYLPKL